MIRSDKEAKDTKMKEFKNTRFNAAVYSVLFAVIMIACTIGICILADHADEKYALKADMSFNSGTKQSKVTDDILGSLDCPVNIIMLSSGDNEKDISYNESAAIEILLNRYAAVSSNISFEKTKYILSPYLSDRYTDGLGKNIVSNDCLIIHCDKTNRTRILVSDDYYSYSFDTSSQTYNYVQNYERVITQAIKFVAMDELPVAQFITGHGELGEKDISVMTNDLSDACYNIEFVDLMRSSPVSSSPVFIIYPRYDFTETEVRTLEQYALDGGDFFIALDSENAKNMPNFISFILNWGISPINGVLVSESNAINNIPEYIKPELMESNATLRLIAAKEDVFWLVNSTAFRSTDALDKSYRIEKILSCADSYVTENTKDLKMAESDSVSKHDAALLSERRMPGGEMSNLFIIGDIEMFINESLHDRTSAKPFLLVMTQYISPNKYSPPDIDSHNVQRAGVTEANLTSYLIPVLLIPFLILMIALPVLLYRRNK